MDTNTLLEKWEDVYKRGLLTLWLLLFIDDNPSYPYEINERIKEFSKCTITAEMMSIYRSLSRLEEAGILKSTLEKSNSGPSRKYYSLTALGDELLSRFIKRNILVFQQPDIKERLLSIVSREAEDEQK
jgi:PadR family transcriptional regulator PadR